MNVKEFTDTLKGLAESLLVQRLAENSEDPENYPLDMSEAEWWEEFTDLAESERGIELLAMSMKSADGGTDEAV